ncbi:MAG: SHOCT domain-containing protein [Ancalomicrobiaceae bacterium]|nr:SHOCT domain-containing protein [Ancalomicrobiaceae bacterium]
MPTLTRTKVPRAMMWHTQMAAARVPRPQEATMMGWGWGWSWSGSWGMPMFGMGSLLLIALVVVIVVLLARQPQPRPGRPHVPAAREILDRRYAAGEISRDQYEQMKRDLA